MPIDLEQMFVCIKFCGLKTVAGVVPFGPLPQPLFSGRLNFKHEVNNRTRSPGTNGKIDDFANLGRID